MLSSNILTNNARVFHFKQAYKYQQFVLFRFLLENGADKSILTDEGERPLDLVDPSDMETIRVMLKNIRPDSNNQSEDEL